MITLQQFEHWFREHYAFLTAVALKITGDESSAQDIVQNLFVKIWQKRDSLLIQGPFLPYAARSVRNMCYDHLESKLGERRFYASTSFPDIQEDFLQESESLDLLQRSTDSIMNYVEELPDIRKQIFKLYVFKGYSYQQIADEMHISINTVKTQMKRSYQWLRSKAGNDPELIILLSILMGHSIN